MATTAGAPPGSGANFAALSGKLAARGAHNPGALAAWIGRRKYGKKGFAKLGSHSHASDSSAGQVIDLDWAEWDAGHRGGGGSSAHDTASATAHNTASATAKRHMASKGQRASADSGVRGFTHKSASQLKYGHNVVFGNKGQLEEHKVISVARKANGSVRLHTLGPGGQHHYQNMKANAQVSYRDGGGLPQVLKAGGFAGQTKQGNPYGLANTAGRLIDMADAMCPRCGYKSDDADFAISGGASGTTSPGQPEQLRTPQPHLPKGSGTIPLTVRGASPNLGLANGQGRSISLSRRMPVRTHGDLMVARQPDGSAVIRHRQGATEIGMLRPGGDGTWQSVVDGHDLTPGRSQRAALAEMIGVYNGTTVTPDRAAQPLVPAPVQTPLMQQYGVEAIRLAGDNDADDASDNGGGGDNGLNPRGQGIYKKLTAKGVSPKVAMAMAKRAQNKTAGSFGG
jgi:hypothetical protein